MTDFVTLGSNERWTEASNPWPERPAWFDRAACAGLGADLFFTDASGQSSAEALAVCATCEVREPCLQWALVNNDIEGVFGGLTPAQRRRLKRKPRQLAGGDERHTEILRLRAQGLSQDEIAAELGISQSTVHRHLQDAS